MGLFSKEAIDEFKEDMKNLGDKIRNFVDNKTEKNVEMKCKGCGSNLISTTSQKTIKCEYCGLVNVNENYKITIFSNSNSEEDKSNEED